MSDKSPSKQPECLPLSRFLHHVCKEKHPERRFCFILGSGASVESGIKTGASLVNEWMAVIEQNYSDEELKQWQDECKIDTKDLAASYAHIFDKRFELDQTIGFHALEKAMENIEPSCGYSVLAHILANTKNNTVITTNFDSLTEDALFIYTQKKPLVVSHEALAQFINPLSQRPLIIKIHRDLLLSPKNSENEVHELADGFETKLQSILQNYTPIVIGYGGNDGSLMGLLEQMPQLPGGIFWCYRPEDNQNPISHGLNERIIQLVDKHQGKIVPIPGFDSLLIQMGDQLGFGRFDGEVIAIANKRAEKYRNQIAQLTGSENITTETKSALTSISAKGDKDWWYYEQLVNAESEIDKKEQIYLQAIAELGDELGYKLHHNYAVLLHYTRKDYDEAASHYLKALATDPEHVYANNNYANLLFYVRKDYDKAASHYLRALATDPEDVHANYNYANLLYDVRKDYDKAESHYLKALAVDPEYAHANTGYANLLYDVRKDYDKAASHYLKALATDPEDVHANYNYANLLKNICKDYDKAASHYLKALATDPEHVHANYNYANLLFYVRKDYDKAASHYLKALATDPEHVHANDSYARLLSDVYKDYDKAEQHFQIAVDKAVDDANVNANYAKHLLAQHKLTEAQTYIHKALELNQAKEQGVDLELYFYCYAGFVELYPEAKAKVEALLAQGVSSPGWYLDDIIEVARSLDHPQIEEVIRLAGRISEK